MMYVKTCQSPKHPETENISDPEPFGKGTLNLLFNSFKGVFISKAVLQREKEKERPSVHWVVPQMATTGSLKPGAKV